VRICVLGLGAIGTTYGYAFQKAGHQVEHWVRESKRDSAPRHLAVDVLDGRHNKKGEKRSGTYDVTLAEPGTNYDFILLSVAQGKLADAINTLRAHSISGTLILFCNFWDEPDAIAAMAHDYPYVIAFPTAGGTIVTSSSAGDAPGGDSVASVSSANTRYDRLECVLFDHIMLERKEKADIPNYDDLITLLRSADISTETPHDMIEWIWVHMAINAGVTSTAARAGNLENPTQLAIELMNDSRALAQAVRTIRETVSVVAARGVDLKLYRGELLPYRAPAPLAGTLMKRMFAHNELTRRIMTLHNNTEDILYGCTSVYKTAKQQGLELPLFFANMEQIYRADSSRSRRSAEPDLAPGQ